MNDPIIIIITPPPPTQRATDTADTELPASEYDKALDLIQVAKATGARVRILREDLAHTLVVPADTKE